MTHFRATFFITICHHEDVDRVVDLNQWSLAIESEEEEYKYSFIGELTEQDETYPDIQPNIYLDKVHAHKSIRSTYFNSCSWPRNRPQSHSTKNMPTFGNIDFK